MHAKAIIPSAQPPIADVEWKFSSITNKGDNLSELRELLVYEYAREESWMVDAIAQCKRTRKTVSYEKKQGSLSGGDFTCVSKTIDTTLAKQQWCAKLRRTPPKQNFETQKEIVFQISARLRKLSNKHRPFIDYDSVFTLDRKFPLPYLSNPSHFALLVKYDAVPRNPVEDLKICSVRLSAAEFMSLRTEDGASWKALSGVLLTFSQENGVIVSEDNGRPINFPKDEVSIIRFALGINFSLPNEDLQEAFGKFLSSARKEYSDLPNVSHRPLRGTPPAWPQRTCIEALHILSVYRLVRAFEENKIAAYEYYSKYQKSGGTGYPSYATLSEFIRAAKKFRDKADLLFRGAIQDSPDK